MTTYDVGMLVIMSFAFGMFAGYVLGLYIAYRSEP